MRHPRSPRTTAGRLLVPLLAALALGGCGGGTATVDGAPDRAPEQVRLDAAGRAAAASAQLHAVRQTYPTAGLDVPPSSLTRTVADGPLLRTATDLRRVDGFDIGWPEIASRPRTEAPAEKQVAPRDR
ncbi:hypothetical protein [Ornithinimicrobium cerasi]|uniref:hypothetical protein n=1 Tax=Ornithinimicrobium cerasi TaxID=2248773 RepID=UPI00137A234E|nr:hypothetical protein [Ornithinimicrobium cerasi]